MARLPAIFDPLSINLSGLVAAAILPANPDFCLDNVTIWRRVAPAEGD